MKYSPGSSSARLSKPSSPASPDRLCTLGLDYVDSPPLDPFQFLIIPEGREDTGHTVGFEAMLLGGKDLSET